LYLFGHPIVAHEHARVAQAAALPLNDQPPKRIAGGLNELGPRVIEKLCCAVMLRQRR
jgi:hypothetical protein